MKKTILLICALLFLLCGCTSNNSSSRVKEIEDVTKFTEMMKTKDGLYFMAYPECKYCNAARPILEQVLEEEDAMVYYYNTDNGLPDEEYYQMVDMTKEFLPGEDILVPIVIAIKDGKVLDLHISVVPGYTIENKQLILNNEQKQQLKDIYKDLIALLR